MSKVWIFNLILFLVIIFAGFIIGIGYLINMFKSLEFQEPVPRIAVESPVEAEPSIEIVEEVESVFAYTYEGESVPRESENVYLTKVLTLTNPNDYPVTVNKIKTKMFDPSGNELRASEDELLYLSYRTLAPGETAYFAASDQIFEVYFREDYGYSESIISVNKAFREPYTNLEVENVEYQFRDADPGNTMLQIKTRLLNNSSTNVDTTELDFVILLYDHEGNLIGGDTERDIAYKPERIRPNEQKELSFESMLIGKEFSRNVGSVKVFAGCDVCKAS